jgi:hypothetical protein
MTVTAGRFDVVEFPTPDRFDRSFAPERGAGLWQQAADEQDPRMVRFRDNSGVSAPGPKRPGLDDGWAIDETGVGILGDHRPGVSYPQSWRKTMHTGQAAPHRLRKRIE